MFNIPLNRSRTQDKRPPDPKPNVFDAESDRRPKKARRPSSEAESNPVVISDSESSRSASPTNQPESVDNAQGDNPLDPNDEVEEISEGEFYNSTNGHEKSDSTSSFQTAAESATQRVDGELPQRGEHLHRSRSAMSIEADVSMKDTPHPGLIDSDEDGGDYMSPIGDTSFDAANPGAATGSKRRAGQAGHESPLKRSRPEKSEARGPRSTSSPRRKTQQRPGQKTSQPMPDIFKEFGQVFSDVPPFRPTMDMSGMAQTLPGENIQEPNGIPPVGSEFVGGNESSDNAGFGFYDKPHPETLQDPVNRTVPLSFSPLDLESSIPTHLKPPEPPVLHSNYTAEQYVVFNQSVAQYLEAFCRFQADAVKYLQRRIDADYRHGAKLAASSPAIYEYNAAMISNSTVLATYRDAILAHRQFLGQLYKLKLEREQRGLRT
jgi:hypothetical protein